jgi:hypothetical protein
MDGKEEDDDDGGVELISKGPLVDDSIRAARAVADEALQRKSRNVNGDGCGSTLDASEEGGSVMLDDSGSSPPSCGESGHFPEEATSRASSEPDEDVVDEAKVCACFHPWIIAITLPW